MRGLDKVEATSRFMKQVTRRDRCKLGLGLSVGRRSPAEVSQNRWGGGGAAGGREGGREARGQVMQGGALTIKDEASPLIPHRQYTLEAGASSPDHTGTGESSFD